MISLIREGENLLVNLFFSALQPFSLRDITRNPNCFIFIFIFINLRNLIQYKKRTSQIMIVRQLKESTIIQVNWLGTAHGTNMLLPLYTGMAGDTTHRYICMK